MDSYKFMYDGVQYVVEDECVLRQLEEVLSGFGDGKEIVKLNETPDGRYLRTAIQVCRHSKDVDIPHAKNRYTLKQWLMACLRRVGDGSYGNNYGNEYSKAFNPNYVGMRWVEFSKGYVGSRLNGMPSTANELVNAKVCHAKHRERHLAQMKANNDANARRKVVEERNFQL